MEKLKRISFILLVVAAACGQAIPKLEDIDQRQWKDDKNGCAGKRTTMTEALQRQATALQGLSEMQIIDLLGRPDQNELYSRNQKFYVYFLEPGKACGKEMDGHKLSIRFNATGLAKEVVVE